jgi:hypothetical protein
MLEEEGEKEKEESGVGGGDCDVSLIQSLRTISCWLCETIYLIYSQLLFLCGGHLLHPQLGVASCHTDRHDLLTGKQMYLHGNFIINVKHLWDVGIHCDNHVRFCGRPAKTVPSRVRLLYTGRCVLRSG